QTSKFSAHTLGTTSKPRRHPVRARDAGRRDRATRQRSKEKKTMSNTAPKSATDFLAGIEGQRVLITAGASGIGFAIASTLSSLGARVAICDISDMAIAEARRTLPMLVACKADVSVDGDVEAMFKNVQREW